MDWMVAAMSGGLPAVEGALTRPTLDPRADFQNGPLTCPRACSVRLGKTAISHREEQPVREGRLGHAWLEARAELLAVHELKDSDDSGERGGFGYVVLMFHVP